MPGYKDADGKDFVSRERLQALPRKSLSLAAPAMAAAMRKLVEDSIQDETYVVSAQLNRHSCTEQLAPTRCQRQRDA
jgi:hypothetical protein